MTGTEQATTAGMPAPATSTTPSSPRPAAMTWWWIPALMAVALAMGAVREFGATGYTAICVLAIPPVVVAAWCDLWAHWLPLHATVPAIAVTVVGAAALGIGEPAASVRALGAAIAVFVVLSVAGAATGLFTFGDVLLCVPLVILLAYHGWDTLARAALLLPFVALPAAVLAAVRARSLLAPAALVPWLLVATVIALATG